ncbi:bifunctional lysylphosphatidylglycerol flippase/synthetase MprF [Sinomonas susongensis]|uniref:bifunctional lysylphosphatidylglycerol flippase/synthetase MprF n=1 Tax=Sinomonas susongensis TaxID=1324851 RepID=UPI0014861F1E|nr:DUF2156 domain-containing protein [Sinomonas susongensis]
MAASALSPGSVPGFVLGAVLLGGGGAWAERRLGAGRFMAAALGTHAGAVLAASGLAWALRATGGAWSAQLLTHSFSGPTAMALGAVAAATAASTALWRRRLRLAVMALLTLLLLYSGTLPDMTRFLAAALGLALGPALLGRGPRLSVQAVSRREMRTLVAVTVAVAALGPVLAGLLPHAVGPFAVLHLAFTGIQPTDPLTVRALCADPSQARDCATALLQQRAGAGAIFMAVLPSVLLLLFAEGLRRGRRAAWAGALAVEAVLAVLAASCIGSSIFPVPPGAAGWEAFGGVDASTFRNRLALVLPLLTPAALAGLLVVARGHFAVRAPGGTYLRLAARLAGAAGALALLYFGAALTLIQSFSPIPGPLELLANIPDRFLPLGYLFDVPPAFVPVSVPATVLYEGVGIVFWGSAAALALATFLGAAGTPAERDRERAADILAASGGSSLSWMTTWSGNRYWFTPAGTGYIAYRPHAGVALALGPPVCPAGEEDTALRGFSAFATANGWVPCLYSIGPAAGAAAASLGWDRVEVAEDAVLDLQALDFAGRKHQNTRTALNRARREGISARWIRYSETSPALRRQIDVISEEWIADKAMPEMGFTLGGIKEMEDSRVRVLLAVDADGAVHAVSSWLPVHRGGTVTGWTLDFMRRASSGFASATEFLIASAALALRDEGFETLSLSGAPLARSTLGSSGTALDRALDRVGTLLEPIYGFRTLHAFKARFHPRWEPLYLAYPDPAALPAIANALVNAYLPNATPRQLFGLTARVTRGLLRGLLPRLPHPGRAAARGAVHSRAPRTVLQPPGRAPEP